MGARVAAVAAAAAAVLLPGVAGAGFNQPDDPAGAGGPAVRVVANERVDVRWIADFVGDGRVELFDNPGGTGTPIDAKATLGSANDQAITFWVGALIRPDTTYYFRVTHRDPTGNLPDLTNSAPLPRLFTGAQTIGAVSVEAGLDSARISWDANVIGVGRVAYGVAYGVASPDEQTVEDGLNVEGHSIELTGLVPGTTYHFRVANRHAIDGGTLVKKAGSFTTDGVAPSTFSLDPKRTYLRTNGDAPLDALKIDLGALGIAGGSTVKLERLGAYDCGSPCVDDRRGMIGVFSAGSMLLPTDQRHRVPGALDAGPDVATGVTYFVALPTDIPEDFAISDTTLRVPDGATHLFVGVHDSLYVDNTDPNGDFAIRVSLSNPTAVDDSYSVDEDATLDVAAPGVLANDGDPQGQPLSAVLVTGPASGSLALRADGSFTYAPAPNFNGSDSFTYKASDGTADSAPATVAITVNAVDDAPVAAADGPYLGIVGQAVTFDGSASDDVEGAPLTYRWEFGDGSTLVTTSPTAVHAYAAGGVYTVTLVVDDGALASAPATTSATIGSPIGSGRADVDAFLSYASPSERTVHLPAGTTSFDVTIVYGSSIAPSTFSAELEGSPFAGFAPTPASSETVTVPLSPGRNVLVVSVEGMLADGRTAVDRDRLTFVVR